MQRPLNLPWVWVQCSIGHSLYEIQLWTYVKSVLSLKWALHHKPFRKYRVRNIRAGKTRPNEIYEIQISIRRFSLHVHVVFCASLPYTRVHAVCNNVCVPYICLLCSAVPCHILGCTRCAIHVCIPEMCVCLPDMCLLCSAVPYHTLGCTLCAVICASLTCACVLRFLTIQ